MFAMVAGCSNIDPIPFSFSRDLCIFGRPNFPILLIYFLGSLILFFTLEMPGFVHGINCLRMLRSDV